VPHMLPMPALELRDPVAVLVHVISDNASFHAPIISALRLQSDSISKRVYCAWRHWT
jgi:hypothetical protein